MQQRRFRPGDVLDDYCPRERRITDHAVVAMIDDTIKQTRCCVCDAEHEFKNGKLPAQRRRKGQSALFTQVLEGLQGPHPARLSHPDADAELTVVPDLSDHPQTPDAAATFEPLTAEIAALPETQVSPDEPSSNNGHSTRLPAAIAIDDAAMTDEAPIEEGPVRRSLIRATLPRPEGQAPPARVIPEFTIRQPNHGRGRHGRRRGGQMHSQGNQGPMRFGRSGHGNGQSHGQGQGQGHGQRSHGGRNRSRRGGKKR